MKKSFGIITAVAVFLLLSPPPAQALPYGKIGREIIEFVSEKISDIKRFFDPDVVEDLKNTSKINTTSKIESEDSNFLMAYAANRGAVLGTRMTSKLINDLEESKHCLQYNKATRTYELLYTSNLNILLVERVHKLIGEPINSQKTTQQELEKCFANKMKDDP